MALIYKICPQALWREAETSGRFAGSPVDLADGFIHFSTAAQVEETAARHFAGERDLVLVRVEAEGLGDALRYEPSRGGELFPHLYGPLAVGVVQSVAPLPLGSDGRHVFPDPAEAAPAAPAGDPATLGWSRLEARGLIASVGPLWTKTLADGIAVYGFSVETRHLNRNGVMHGGALMTFADEALGLTAWRANGRKSQVTIQLDTHFVSAVQAGEFIEAQCRVVRRTRSLMFMAGELVVGRRVAATAHGVWKILGA